MPDNASLTAWEREESEAGESERIASAIWFLATREDTLEAVVDAYLIRDACLQNNPYDYALLKTGNSLVRRFERCGGNLADLPDLMRARAEEWLKVASQETPGVR